MGCLWISEDTHSCNVFLQLMPSVLIAQCSHHSQTCTHRTIGIFSLSAAVYTLSNVTDTSSTRTVPPSGGGESAELLMNDVEWVDLPKPVLCPPPSPFAGWRGGHGVCTVHARPNDCPLNRGVVAHVRRVGSEWVSWCKVTNRGTNLEHVCSKGSAAKRMTTPSP